MIRATVGGKSRIQVSPLGGIPRPVSPFDFSHAPLSLSLMLSCCLSHPYFIHSHSLSLSLSLKFSSVSRLSVFFYHPPSLFIVVSLLYLEGFLTGLCCLVIFKNVMFLGGVFCVNEACQLVGFTLE